MSPTHARVEAERGDDPLAVLELEELLHRLAVAGGRRDVDDAARVGDAEVGEEHDAWRACCRRRRPARCRPSRRRVVDRSFTSFCRFTQPSRDTMTTLSSSTMKASAEYSTSSVSSMRVRRRSSSGRRTSSGSPRSSSRTSFQRLLLVLEQRADLPRALALLGELVLDDEDLEPRQPIQLQLEDGVGLLGVEREALDDLLGRVRLAVGLADDADDLVERVEDLLEALEDVDALLQLRELVLEARASPRRGGSGGSARASACRSSRSGRPTSAFSVGTRQVMLTAKVVCSGVCLNRYAITRFSSAPGFSSSTMRTSSVGQVADVDEVRHLAAEDDVADLLDELRLVDAVGNAGDVEQSCCRATTGPFSQVAADADRCPGRSCRSPSARSAS